MAINVPSIGLTQRTQIKKKVTQGGPLGPSICAVHIDKIGKEMNFATNIKILTYPH